MLDEEIEISDWVPATADKRLRFLWAAYPDQENRARLQRLASDYIMKTVVWPGLPKSPPNLEGHVIDEVFQCSREDFARIMLGKDNPIYRPMALPHRDQPLGLSLEEIADMAAGLRDAIWESSQYAGPRWTEAGGLTALKELLKDTTKINEICERYTEMARDWQEISSVVPRIRKLGSSKAREWLFVPMVMLQITGLYKREPLIAVVAGLTQVVFNLHDSIDEDTVRKRWRAYRTQLPEKLRFRGKTRRPSI